MSSQLPYRAERRHDVVVIGGGSAGYAAARTAHEAGADVAVVDQGPLGGLCILRGCMPTKAILRSSEVMALMRRAAEFGVAPVTVRADLSAIVDRKNRLVQEFAADRIAALRDGRFTLYEARAQFVSPHHVLVGDLRLQATAFVVATGSQVNAVSIPGLDESGYQTSDSLLDVREPPPSLLVLGGGPVALEFGQFFARIGTQVTVVQRSPRLLSHLDHELGPAVAEAFRDEGIEVLTDTRVQRVVTTASERTLHLLQDGRSFTRSGAMILHALGRRPNLTGLGLDAAGVPVVNGLVAVGPDMRTAQPHIFAVGDANDLMAVVHTAIQQGEVAAYNATHPQESARLVDRRLDLEAVFTDPQVASVGLSEEQCRARAVPYLAASYPFADHGKAMCLGAKHGFVKLLARSDSGALVGAHIVGPDASELIHELVAVMHFHGTVEDLMRMPHYHPTLAEIVTYPAETILERMRRA